MKQLKNYQIHELLFYVFLLLLPIQTRILYNPQTAFIDWYFNYHLALFFYLTDILLIAIFVSWVISDPPALRLRRAGGADHILWLILALFCLILVSLFHVKHLDLGLYQALKWLEMLLLILYIRLSFNSILKFQTVALVVFVSGMFQALIGTFQFHVQHSLRLAFLGEYIAPLGTPGLATIVSEAGKLIRVYGTFPHPNVYGAFLIFALICGLFIVSRETKVRKWLISLGITLMLLGIFVSFSRLSWLAAILTVLSFLFYYWAKNQRSTVIVIVLVSAVSCATIGILWHSALQARVTDSNPTSITDRWFFDRLGLSLIKENPILGVGVGNFVPALEEKFNLEAWQYQPAHNIFIFLATELGLLGLGIFLWLLFEILRKLKNIFSDHLTFTFSLLLFTFLALGIFDHYFVTIQQGRLMFFTVLGLVAALPNIYEKSN